MQARDDGDLVQGVDEGGEECSVYIQFESRMNKIC